MKKIVVAVLCVCCLLQVTSFADEVVVVTSFPKELFETYKQAFEEKHPGVGVVVKSKSTSASVAYVQETRGNPDADLIWASATDAFAVLKGDGLLATHELPEEVAGPIPEAIGPYPFHDPDGFFFGFALSGYGMMWNRLYLQAYGLVEPEDWEDLADARYYAHLSMSAPSRSGTTHLMVEAILQEHGWEEGWKMLLNMAGNMATITERSFGVPQGVNNGEFGIGLVIDFFALSAMASGYPIDFAYPTTTPIIPASIGLVADGPNPERARQFIHFLLSEEGQLLLFAPEISRLPVIPELYAQAPEDFPNPFTMELGSARFDIGISENRYGLVNSLFDQVVTFRLRELKEAWGAIYEAEKGVHKAREEGEETASATLLIAEARSLASEVPVTGAEAEDPGFCGSFGVDGGGAQARHETEWDALTKENYTRAKQLALQALDQLP